MDKKMDNKMDKRYKQEYNRFPHFLVYSVIGRDLYNMVSDSGEETG